MEISAATYKDVVSKEPPYPGSCVTIDKSSFYETHEQIEFDTEQPGPDKGSGPIYGF